MAKYIAHASIDENGKTKGGSAGDQTGKEVCVRTWYSKPWNQFFHIANDEVRIQFGNNMIDIANNNNVGYDQNQRNTLLTQAKKVNFDFAKISTKCECDCSSCITIALLGAIYTILGANAYKRALEILVVSGNCATTSTFKSRATKLTDIAVKCYTSSTYTASTKKAVFGDIYNKSGSHIVCYVDDGKKVVENKILAFQQAAIKDGFSFPKYGTDGEWGSECESVAKKAIIKARKENGKAVYLYQNLTKIVQRAVGIQGDEVDGKCGNSTKNYIVAYQNEHKLEADGCVGLNTWREILGI